jgi:Tol biopolymer transport system component
MNTDRVITDWLRSAAPPRAPKTLFDATLERVATLPQDHPWAARVRVMGGRRADPRLLLVAAVVGGTAILGSLFIGGGCPQRGSSSVAPSVGLGALAYATNGSIFLVGTEREHPDAVEIAANGTGGLSYWAPAWSRDGRYLMFAGAPQGDGPTRIFVVDPQGRQVSSFPGWLPSWSPDSSRVAAWDDAFKTVGIWSVDGRQVSTVPFPTGVTLPGDSTPTFTGDGQALYFVLSRVSSEPKAVPIDGSAPYELSPITTAGNPVFSNDGSQVALPAVDGLYVARGDGSAAHLIAHPATGRFYDAVWSKLDDRIAVAWAGAAQYESLAVIDVASGRTVIVWESAPGDRINPIRWAPDGRSILMSSGSRLYRVEISDQPTMNPTFAAEVLFEDPYHDANTDLAADWQWIAGGG